MPSVMTTFLGQMMELELECFDTVQEVKHKIVNAYFRQIERSDEQMSLEEFKVVSHGLKLDAYSLQCRRPVHFEADAEIIDEVAEAGGWCICMIMIAEVFENAGVFENALTRSLRPGAGASA